MPKKHTAKKLFVECFLQAHGTQTTSPIRRIAIGLFFLERTSLSLSPTRPLSHPPYLCLPPPPSLHCLSPVSLSLVASQAGQGGAPLQRAASLREGRRGGGRGSRRCGDSGTTQVGVDLWGGGSSQGIDLGAAASRARRPQGRRRRAGPRETGSAGSRRRAVGKRRTARGGEL